jgi:hypothetical protein
VLLLGVAPDGGATTVLGLGSARTAMLTTPGALRGLLIGTLILTAHADRPDTPYAGPSAPAEQGASRQRRPDRGRDAQMACMAFVGTWRWFDQGTVTITGDLRAVWRHGATNRVGHTASGECDARTGTVTFAWTNGVTDVIPRPIGASLQGRNNKGMTIWATRLAGAQPRPPAAAPGRRGPDRVPRDRAPMPAPPSSGGCTRTFEEVVAGGARGLPPLLLADRLAERPLSETAVPAALRGAAGRAQVSPRREPGSDGLCATVRVPLAGGRTAIEYRVYAARASSPRLVVLLDAGSGPFTSRQFNDDPRKVCQFVDGRSLSIGCTWGREHPTDEYLRQVVAVVRHVAAGGETGAIEPVRQLAAAAQNHAYDVAGGVHGEYAAWLVTQADRPAGAATGTTPAADPDGGDRAAGRRKVVPLILGLGALAALATLALLALVAVVAAMVYLHLRGRRRGKGSAA